MQSESRTASTTGRLLPWILSAVTLVVFMVTVSRWVTVQSLSVVAQVGGWDNNLPVGAPLLYLLTRPLALVPSAHLPLAGNLLTALLAALTVWTLVRCVLLLPQDRTHAHRIRGYADGRPLHTAFWWVPPILAAGVFAFQLTPWEQATSLTGEMLNALVFGTAIRSLLEFRRSRNERWLDALALLLGVGSTNNWAMTGFAPLFIGALAWIGGWNLLRAPLILRFVALGLAGLLLHLLIPAIGAGRGGLPAGFGKALWATLTTQKDILLGMPKARFAFLAAIMILPLAATGIRWASPRGSALERMLNFGAVNVLLLAWFGANLYMAFDGVGSPRKLITTDPGYGAMPLLTYHFAAALAVAYIAGFFIVLGTIVPDKQWSRADLAGSFVHKFLAWIVVAAGIAVPATLAVRNWTAIRVQNGPILANLAEELFTPLPKKAAVIVTDDALLHALLDARIRRSPDSPRHLLLNTRRASSETYRRHVAANHAAEWPELKAFAEARENVGSIFLSILTKAALNGTAFTLNPSTSFLTEPNYIYPAGAIFAYKAYDPGQVATPALSNAEAATIATYWTAQRAALEGIITESSDRKALAPQYASTFFARAANTQGVLLQRSGHLDPAGQLFALALKLDPDNASATVNAAVNDRLRQRLPIDPSVRKPVEQFGVGVIEEFGPLDEPRSLEQLGEATLGLGDPLVRAAANAFLRARILDPQSIDAAIGYARACVAANEPKFALEAHAQALAVIGDRKLSNPQRSHLHRVKAAAQLRNREVDAAEKTLLAGLQELPDDIPMLDLLSFIHTQTDNPEKSLPYLDRLIKLKPDDEALLQRRGFIHLHAGRAEPAITDFTAVLNRRPDDNPTRMNRGTAFLALGQLDKAQRDFDEVLDRVPDALDARVGLSEVAFRKKDKDRAVRYLEDALSKLEPGTTIHSNLTSRIATIKASP